MKLLIQPSYSIRKMQIFNEVFLKANKSTMNMLHRSYGYVPYESDLLHLGFLWAMICYILLLTYESDDRLWGSLGLSAWKISFTRSWLLDLILRGPATSYGHRSWRHHWVVWWRRGITMLKEEMLETVKITSMTSLEEWTRHLLVLLALYYWKFDIFCF